MFFFCFGSPTFKQDLFLYCVCVCLKDGAFVGGVCVCLGMIVLGRQSSRDDCGVLSGVFAVFGGYYRFLERCSVSPKCQVAMVSGTQNIPTAVAMISTVVSYVVVFCRARPVFRHRCHLLVSRPPLHYDFSSCFFCRIPSSRFVLCTILYLRTLF